MPKQYFDIDVLQAAKERIEWTFDNFSRVYLSFSAGKDSSVMLHLVEEEARKRGRKFGLLLVDLEAQYYETMHYAEQRFKELEDITEQYWCALPIILRNAVSVYDPRWLCWEPDKENIWVRTPPSFAITNTNYFDFFQIGMEFEEFVPEFGEWYANNESTACLVGIRADESLNRFRTIASTAKETFKEKQWTSKVTNNVYNVYPIYDWKTEDIWTYHGKNRDKKYNKLYDLMGMAGLSIHQMRICQPYGDDQRRGLWLFHLIEPETWAKIVARVSGANSGALYIQESGNMTGYRKITRPDNHTWKSFAELLIASMPPAMERHYRDKILLFEKWWIERGYPDGIPDEAPHALEAKRLAPSWRRVCKSLLRNDYWCKGLGFSQHKSSAYQAYQNMMKRRREKWNVSDDALGFQYDIFGNDDNERIDK
jgi:predicted phosphoadenosine phosphosulfate sulfurtransferase